MDLTINLTDINGENGRTSVKNIASAGAAKTFVDWLKDHTDAAITSYTITEPTTYMVAGDAPTDGEHRSCKHKIKADFTVATADDGVVLGRMGLTIPAPDDSDFDGDGQLKSDVAKDLEEALEALTGKKLVFQGGYLVTDHPSVLKKQVTGI